MLLAIDIGNSHLVLGIYQKQTLRHHWRISVSRQKTSDEYGMQFIQMMQWFQIDPSMIKDVIIASVVPILIPVIWEAVTRYFHLKPLLVGARINTGLKLRYNQPEKLGADRLVNAVAAFTLYGGPVIIIDLGTATKICTVNGDGVYLGGVICPGIRALASVLVNTADQLPPFDIIKPATVIGTNTVHCMQSGIVYGQSAMIRGMIGLFKQEIRTDSARVVATGGWSGLIAPEIPEIDIVNEFLTLEGLRILHEKNRQPQTL